MCSPFSAASRRATSTAPFEPNSPSVDTISAPYSSSSWRRSGVTFSGITATSRYAHHPADHRERDAGVPGGRLHDRVARPHRAAALGVLDQRGAVRSLIEPVGLWLSSLARIRTSGLGRRGAARRGASRRSCDEVRRDRRRGRRQADVGRAAPGHRRIRSVSPSDTSVSSQDRSRTSSSLRYVDEAVQLALGGLQLLAHTRMLGVEGVQHLADGRAVDDLALASGGLPQHRRDRTGAHAVAAATRCLPTPAHHAS